jgi:hypothetical protein
VPLNCLNVVELRGLEPLTPTLPGAGRSLEQAAWRRERGVVGVVERAIVVSVVVRFVVTPQKSAYEETATAGCAREVEQTATVVSSVFDAIQVGAAASNPQPCHCACCGVTPWPHAR